MVEPLQLTLLLIQESSSKIQSLLCVHYKATQTATKNFGVFAYFSVPDSSRMPSLSNNQRARESSGGTQDSSAGGNMRATRNPTEDDHGDNGNKRNNPSQNDPCCSCNWYGNGQASSFQRVIWLRVLFWLYGRAI